MTKKWIVEIISLLFVVLFMYTAISKVVDYERFKMTISQSPILTDLAGFIAAFVPLIEIVVAIMLVVPRLRLVALYSSFALMVTFTAYIAAILNSGQHIPCSCGGVIGEMGWTAHFIFNIAFIILALLALLLYDNNNIYKKISSVARN